MLEEAGLEVAAASEDVPSSDTPIGEFTSEAEAPDGDP